MLKPLAAALALLTLSLAPATAAERRGRVGSEVYGCPSPEPVAQMLAWRASKEPVGPEGLDNGEREEAHQRIYRDCRLVEEGARVSYSPAGPNRPVKVTQGRRTFWVAPNEIR